MSAAYLELLPAVDIKGGKAVQLVQGIDGSEKVFGDPIEAALRWQEMGAEWIHLVDLDAAFGHGSNADLLAEVTRAVDIKIERETCGTFGCHWKENYVGGTCTRNRYRGGTAPCNFSPGNNSKAHRIVMSKRNDQVTIKGKVQVS